MLHIYNIYLSPINQYAMPNTIRPKKKAKMKGKNTMVIMKGKNTMVIYSIYYSLLQNNYIFTLPKKSMNFSLKVI
jgi:hypothetical protein